jgi:cytosine/adenosine deaminase-related metal-dependent hydrolase
MTWTLTARWIFPVDAPPLHHGTISIADDRIESVEAHGRRTPDTDLGNVALLPGFVNTHTHLDLGGLRGLAYPSADFTGWLRRVITHRRSQSPEQVQAAIQAGIAEAVRFGTTLLGDITSGGASWDALSKAPCRAVVFHELLGLAQDRVVPALESAYSWLSAHPAQPTSRPGLSPHAPYSVRQEMFSYASKLCGWFHAPLAVHLAESPDELELLRHHRGKFVPFLQELGVWDPDGLVPNTRAVVRLCARAPRLLLIHANYFAAPSAVPRRATVVYCPRTHAAFGHPPHPLSKFLARRVRVALGTDSLASNPDLDLLAEARFVHARFPELPGEVLLRMITLAGAEALGWQDETGSLTTNKSADLVVLPLPEEESSDPHLLLWQSTLPVQSVMVRGRWVFSTVLCLV